MPVILLTFFALSDRYIEGLICHMDFTDYKCHGVCYARIGLIGNPSDGFGGKTISFLLKNFHATVTIKTASSGIKILPNPKLDPGIYSDLNSLLTSLTIEGYYGGTRLLLATCKAFTARCKDCGILDRLTCGFEMSYDSQIPRMVGLSGSSAIIIAAFRALLTFYNLTLADLGIPLDELPTFILQIEMKELGIAAGLQDRVIQVYGGLVSMDFSGARGLYEYIDEKLLPPLYVAYNTDNGGESGKVHSNVRQRWTAGEPAVVEGMANIASLVDKALVCLRSNDVATLATLIDNNFALRRQLYGDDVVGHSNILAAQTANAFGLAAKFTGSGGAFLLLKRDGSGWLSEDQEARLTEKLGGLGFELLRAEVEGPCQWG